MQTDILETAEITTSETPQSVSLVDRWEAGELGVTTTGLLYDRETGECFGLVDEIIPDWFNDGQVKPKFEVTTREHAEWVLDKMTAEQVEINALDLRKQAFLKNIEAQQRVHINALQGLHFRFDADLREWTRKQLDGTKAKHFKTDYGKLKLGMAGGGALLVADEAKAIEWAKENFPDAVKRVESILATPIKKLPVEQLPSALFSFSLPVERFDIDLGVEPVAVKKGKTNASD